MRGFGFSGYVSKMTESTEPLPRVALCLRPVYCLRYGILTGMQATAGRAGGYLGVVQVYSIAAIAAGTSGAAFAGKS